MTKALKYILPVLLICALLCGPVPAAPAVEPVTAAVEVNGGSQVTVSGTTTPDTSVTLLVTRITDSDKSHMDQARSGGDGGYSFSFQLPAGAYRASVTANGITVQKDFNIGNVTVAAVTVRVEGENATLLPHTEMGILEGETTLLEAVQRALDDNGVDYLMSGGMIDSIKGEAGWQWMLNGRGGMALPTTLLQGGDQIVLVDDKITDPVITKLSLAADKVAAGQNFTATLHKVESAGDVPAPDQPVLFSGTAKMTDRSGQVTFKTVSAGEFKITANTTGSLIRPVPVKITVSGSGGSNPGTDPVGSSITVKMRIEGYRDTIMDGYVTFNPEDYKGEEGKYRFTGPDGVEYVNDRATVLLATVMAWNQNGIRDNSVGYQDNYVARMAGEEEFDFESGHPTCGWLVRVNNKLINEGVGVWPVRDGDKIEWYYGDVNSYFGSMEVTPTSLKTGEQLKVKVFGRSNGGMSMSNTSRKEPMEEAAVYVGSEEYTTGANGEVEITMKNPGTFEVYAVKLDKDASNGGCYFPLMSRTEKVRVKVTGESIETVVPVPEDPADAARVIKEVLDNPEADGNLVAETVKAAAISLANSLAKVQTAADAAALLDNTAAVTGLLDQAAGRITGDQAAATFAGSCLQITSVLAGLAPQITGEENRETLARSAVEAVNAVVAVLDGITGVDELAAIAIGLLDHGAEILTHFEGQQAQSVKESLIAMARQVLARLDGQTLPEEALQMEEDRLIAVIDASIVQGQSNRTPEAAAQLIQKLARLGVEQNLIQHRDMVIDIPSHGENAVSITLSAGTLAAVAANSNGRLTINTSAAAFNLGPDTFTPGAGDQDIVLTAARVDSAGLPAGTSVPPGSIVVDLGATVGGQSIAGFNTPVQVSIPYAGSTDNPAAVTVFLLKDDGTLEPVGGLYDQSTGLVTFLTGHFSKYLAKESVKKFDDLAKYDWARDSVEILAGKGIIGGKAEEVFAPGDQVTRAEFAALLTRMLKYPTGANTALPFDDVSRDQWYHGDVAAAYAHGLISGRSATVFDPEGDITRQEMACIIAKVLEQKGQQPAGTTQLDQFKDKSDIADWAAPSADMVVGEGIMGSAGEGQFAPRTKATRAQVAVMLYRLYDRLLGPGV